MRQAQRRIVGGAYPRAGAFDDGMRRSTQPRPPVDAAFQHQEALLRRHDAHRRQRGQVIGLNMVADDDDLDAVHHQHGSRPHVVEFAARHRADVAVAPIAQQAHAARDGARLAHQANRRHCQLAPQRQREGGAHAGRQHLLHGRRVVNRKRSGLGEAGVQHRTQHRHRVHRAARCAVVAVVQQHHRAAVGGFGIGNHPRAGHRFGQRLNAVDKPGAGGPGRVQQRITPAQRLVGITVAHHHG